MILSSDSYPCLAVAAAEYTHVRDRNWTRITSAWRHWYHRCFGCWWR